MVENFRPGTLERWGLGPDDLYKINPELVLVRMTGFGQTGPYAHQAGFGTLAEAMSGFAFLTGPADGPPTLPAFGLADSIAGIAAVAAALTALRHRDTQGGGGQVVDLSILEPIMTAVGPGPTVYDQLGIVQTRHGNRSTNNAPRNVYATSDGMWVAVSTSAQRVAERVLRLVGHPEVISEPWFGSGHGRAEHSDLLDGYVACWIGARTRAEVITEFEQAGAAVAAVYSAADIVADPHVRQTGMVTEVDDPDLGPMLMHNVLWRMSRTPGQIRFTGRPLGADTDAVLDPANPRLRLSAGDRPARARSGQVSDALLEVVRRGVRIFDLGQPMFTGMPQSPNHPRFLHTVPRRHGDARYGWTADRPPTTCW